MTEHQASIVELAKAIATAAHAGQFRRDGKTLYIEHPRAVASRSPNAPEAQATAWLHDVLEDTPLTADDLLAKGVPKRVVDAVVLLTKRSDLSYEANLERIAADPLARQVKIADMLSNLADAPTEDQIRKYAAGLLQMLNARPASGCEDRE